MIRLSKTAILAVGLATLLGVTGAQAAKTKAKLKPKAKNASTHHEVAGTTQLKGSTPKFGETWTLGKSNPWNVKMNSAEYSVEPLRIGDTLYCPKANEKLLVLHYTVHNPQKGEGLMRFDTFHFTAVDSKDANWEYINEIGNQKDQVKYDVQMKPAQKTDVYTAIIVPAAGVIPKLIVKGSDDLVLRYDLREKVKPLPAPFADPNDKSGATALGTVPAEMGTYYPVGDFDIKLDETAPASRNVGGVELDEGKHWLVAKFTAKNKTQSKAQVRFDTFLTKLTDQDGAEIERSNDMYAASRDASLDTQIDPGQEITFRFAFQVGNDQKLKTLTIQQGSEGRAYAYDASSFK